MSQHNTFTNLNSLNNARAAATSTASFSKTLCDRQIRSTSSPPD
ncbi:hypothetical protein OGM63_09285 [Plectonema radiosum NIES-515]|uniref:Uncharacterized protein n=1 Tax=Plectonema radiosum NIES-515 TaxID=2986073 RepID=A0ABT3AX51_9CYAN|nr:hypothetical protein [Plectonema radiosum]MCV3213702.1 hypothetical protein [Plectonema radiosum NIES-515]